MFLFLMLKLLHQIYDLQALFLHSADEKFAVVGAKSGIDYGKLFSQYKQIIILGLHRGQRRWIQLMQWYNAEIFGWEPAKKNSNADVSAIDEALNDDDDIEDDDNEEDEQAPGWDEISFAELNPLNDDEQQDDGNPNDDLQGDNRVCNLIHPVLALKL
jgi:hypothetical protein